MENPIKTLRRKIRMDYEYVADYQAAEDFLRRISVYKSAGKITLHKRRPFIVIFIKRFFRMRDRIWCK